jgi:hypothetical protein
MDAERNMEGLATTAAHFQRKLGFLEQGFVPCKR